MKCKICGRECLPGARICRDCASARKRAFAVTVTEPLLAAAGIPSVAEPRFAPKPARPRPAVAPAVDSATAPPEAPAALPLHVVPRTLGVHWLLIGLAMTATIVVLLVKVLAGDSGGSGGNGRATDDVGATASSAVPPPAVVTPAPLPPAGAGVAQDNPASAKTLGDLPPAKSAPGKSLQRKAPPRPDAASVVVAAPPPPAPEPAAVVRSPAPPRAIEAPRSDPWQVMNEGLSRCAREDLFSRPGCEERLRQQYCPNNWGLVPQCPIGRPTDHGQ
jgi:hypothetical protein